MVRSVPWIQTRYRDICPAAVPPRSVVVSPSLSPGHARPAQLGSPSIHHKKTGIHWRKNSCKGKQYIQSSHGNTQKLGLSSSTGQSSRISRWKWGFRQQSLWFFSNQSKKPSKVKKHMVEILRNRRFNNCLPKTQVFWLSRPGIFWINQDVFSSESHIFHKPT